MATEAEIRRALEAGASFVPAIRKVLYDVPSDRIFFLTPWGEKSVGRTAVKYFRNVGPSDMEKIYASHVGVHIDDIDFDINSAGLLAEIFPELRDKLTNSY